MLHKEKSAEINIMLKSYLLKLYLKPMTEYNQLTLEIQKQIHSSPLLLSEEIQVELQRIAKIALEKVMEQQLNELIEIRKNQDLLFTNQDLLFAQTNQNTEDIARVEQQNKLEIARLKEQINELCRDNQKLKGMILQNIFSAM